MVFAPFTADCRQFVQNGIHRPLISRRQHPAPRGPQILSSPPPYANVPPSHPSPQCNLKKINQIYPNFPAKNKSENRPKLCRSFPPEANNHTCPPSTVHRPPSTVHSPLCTVHCPPSTQRSPHANLPRPHRTTRSTQSPHPQPRR